MNPWVHPQCAVGWHIPGQEGDRGLRAPLGLGKASGGTREGSLWLPLPLHAGRRFCNISSPGGIKRAAEERDTGGGTAAGTGEESSPWRDPWLWCCPASHHTLYRSPLGVTSGFKPLPVCFPLRNSLGLEKTPHLRGRRQQQAVSPWDVPLEIVAFLGLCQPHSAHLSPFTCGAGWGGLLQLPKRLLGARVEGGGGWEQRGCAEGSSGVQTLRSLQGHQPWVLRGRSACSHYLAQE